MKSKNSSSGIVYSTNPSFKPEGDFKPAAVSLPPSEQKLKIQISTRHRAGKTVTLIHNFVGTEADLETLARTLKSKCGTGGSAKDGEIIIQGDFRDKLVTILTGLGYGAKRI